MTENWTVKFTDRSEAVVVITTTRNPRVNESRAMHRAEQTLSKVAFSARPEGCTGFAWNVHFSADNTCPVHGKKVER